MPIRVLSDELASRIAAGEVIERPASVVKELVENSLDAKSTRVDVLIGGGGAKSITVIDNGQGIPAEEFPTAFERFATSKIDESSDLISIGTLGFRGEALPSIGSVARVEAISKHCGQEIGARYVVDCGIAGIVEPAAVPQGTRIQVSGLFTNVPVRLKFLGSANREFSRVHKILASFALIYPYVAFTLSADGRERFHTEGSGNLIDAVSGIYGANIAEQMLQVELDDTATFSVDGLVSSPSLTRSNRTYITLAVNGRAIQSRRLTYAIEQAYHGFLPARRFPVVIARIRTPLDDVDANVHPAKAQVRFLREDLVYSVVQRAIRGVLSVSSPVHRLGASRSAGSKGLLRPVGKQADFIEVDRLGIPDSTATSNTQAGYSMWPGSIVQRESSSQHSTAVSKQNPDSSTIKDTLPILRVVGQVHQTYIAAEGPNGVYLIDQHAAHERITFEELKRWFNNNSTESQPLLEPNLIDLAPGAMTTVQEHFDELNRIGWGFEEFGGNSLIVRNIPAPLAVRAGSDGIGQIIMNVLDSLSAGGDGESWLERMLASTACHSSVRAGQTLSIDECKGLILQLEGASQPDTCPHGRPTIVQLTINDLEREFKRR